MKKKIWIYKVFLFISLSILLNSCEKDKNEPEPVIEYGTVDDIDGNSYKTVKIGTQWWMAENLKVTRYQNGDPIINIIDNVEWQNNRAGAYCKYENESGNIYNSYAVFDKRNIAPSGWHVPSFNEWDTFKKYIDSTSICITDPDWFNAFPCAGRQSNGIYAFNEGNCWWWGATYFDAGSVWTAGLSGCSVSLRMQGYRNGYSVRCLKD